MKALDKYRQLDPATSTLPILVFDIETVRSHEVLPTAGEVFEAWKYKRRKENEVDYEALSLSFNDSAPLYAAFTKVVAASFAYYKAGRVLLKSFAGDDEKELLIDIAKFLDDKKVKKQFILCGHSIKNYDMPILCKRYLANSLPVPEIIDNSGLKPWEISAIDMMELLKMSGFYNESLTEACLLLGVKSSKSENVDGSKVSDIFYGASKDEVNLKTISQYCNDDTFATLNCLLRVLGWDVVENYDIK